jgi:hypothetical protein
LLAAVVGWNCRLQIAQVCAAVLSPFFCSISFRFFPAALIGMNIANEGGVLNRLGTCWRHRINPEESVVKSMRYAP